VALRRKRYRERKSLSLPRLGKDRSVFVARQGRER
jgi:hypothetical protein